MKIKSFIEFLLALLFIRHFSFLNEVYVRLEKLQGGFILLLPVICLIKKNEKLQHKIETLSISKLMKQISLTLFFTCLTVGLLAQPKSYINKKDTLIYNFLYSNDSPNKILFSYNGKMGIMDSNKNVLLNANFDRVLAEFDDDGFYYHFVYLGNKKGIIDANFKFILPLIYDDIEISKNGFFIAKNKEGYIYINHKGVPINNQKYQRAKSFRYGLASIKTDGKWGFIDRSGEIIINPVYDKTGWFNDDGITAVKKDGKYGFINKLGETTIAHIYQKTSYFTEGLCAVKKEGKWGFINVEGDEVIPFIYKGADRFVNGLATVKKNIKWGYIDMDNNLIIKYQYYKAYSFSGNSALVKKNIFKWTHIYK